MTPTVGGCHHRPTITGGCHHHPIEHAGELAHQIADILAELERQYAYWPDRPCQRHPKPKE